MVTQAHRRRLGCKGNPNYASFSASKLYSAAEKYKGGGEYRQYSASPILRSKLFKCIGYKSRIGLGFSFAKKLDFKCKWWDPLGCLLKEERKTRVRAFQYFIVDKDLGPGRDPVNPASSLFTGSTHPKWLLISYRKSKTIGFSWSYNTTKVFHSFNP